jgi:hypothetical protein
MVTAAPNPPLAIQSGFAGGHSGFFHVNLGDMQKIFDNLGSQDKQMLWEEDSDHLVTLEPERERFIRETANFIIIVNRVSS